MTAVEELAKRAKDAAVILRSSPPGKRADALRRMAEKLAGCRERLLAANAADLAAASDLSPAFRKRLLVDETVFDYMAKRLREAAALPDPVGRILENRTMPSGLVVKRVAVPIGVILMIYEARPNVTADAAAVALKSGNAVILRGGSEALRSNLVLAEAMRSAVREAGLPEDAVQMVPTSDRAAVAELIKLDKYIDLVIPRGGKSLIRAIEAGTHIPVLKHYDGICHQYVAADADPDMAAKLVVNSKCQNVAVCNALETLLVDAATPVTTVKRIAGALRAAGVELRGCPRFRELVPDCAPATEADWDAEYLAPILSVKIVDGVEDAARHIAEHGSGHTDGIITASPELAEKFTLLVDSASVLVNASTRISGGGDYGMGAVAGISTGRLHARGPVGPEQLCTYKYVAVGNGNLRK